MTAIWPIVCVTGHRDLGDAAGWAEIELTAIATRLRDEHGTTVGVSGMALGADMAWARAVLAAGLDLWAYSPGRWQADPWSPEQQTEWRRLLGLAVKVRWFSDRYSVGALHARNDGMLADSAAVVAIHRPGVTTGGTASAVGKARRRGRPVVHVDPDARAVTWPAVSVEPAPFQLTFPLKLD